MAKCRGSIRDCVRQCEDSEGERPIPPELFDEDGELEEQFIFCCRCTDADAPEVGVHRSLQGAGCSTICMLCAPCGMHGAACMGSAYQHGPTPAQWQLRHSWT